MDMEAKALPGTGNGISTADHEDANKDSAAQDRSPNATNSSKPAVYLTDTNSKVSVHGSYKCTSGKHSGRLLVTSVGICFETAVGSRDQWEMSYDNMKRVEKVRSSSPIFYPLLDVVTDCRRCLSRSIAWSK